MITIRTPRLAIIIVWLGIILALVGTTASAVYTSKAIAMFYYQTEVGVADLYEGMALSCRHKSALHSSLMGNGLSATGLIIAIAGIVMRKKIKTPDE